MNQWPDTDGSAITRYLRQLRLRKPRTRAAYRSSLLSFQAFVAERQCPRSLVSRDILEAWLRERAAESPIHMVLHRARLVDRFLDFLVQEGSITGNPIAELRAQYSLRWSRPVMRALLAPNPNRALGELRRPPLFASVLGELMRYHVALMRANGSRYETQARIFLRFDRFLQGHPELANAPVALMLQRWAAARSNPSHARDCDWLRRALHRARCHLDPSGDPPRPDQRPRQLLAQQMRQPYIYDPKEIRLLLDTARAYPSPRAPLRPLSLYTMLVLAYCAGLRLGELARLDLGDVDLRAGTITIRETKFFKSRILPLASSVVAALQEYLKARQQVGAPQDPTAGLFWHESGIGSRYAPKSIASALIGVLRRAEIKPQRGRTGPRIHDLRHSMVVNRMLA
jgi:site-specific recombinase XerD